MNLVYCYMPSERRCTWHCSYQYHGRRSCHFSCSRHHAWQVNPLTDPQESIFPTGFLGKLSKSSVSNIKAFSRRLSETMNRLHNLFWLCSFLPLCLILMWWGVYWWELSWLNNQDITWTGRTQIRLTSDWFFIWKVHPVRVIWKLVLEAG